MEGLNFIITADDSQFDEKMKRIAEYFAQLGREAMESGQSVDEAMKTFAESINGVLSEATEESDRIGILKEAISEINKELDEMDDSDAKDFLEGVAQGMDDIVKEAEKAQHINGIIDGIADGSVSARQAIKELNQELVAMRMRGEENTEEYQQLLTQLGMIQDAMSDAQQSVRGMASDTAKLDTVMGAAQLTAGAFSSVMGALNLVGADENTKQLAEAQKKLQAVMAITMGLTQVQNALQKQSNVMLGIGRLQAMAAAKAEAIRAAATAKGAVATKAATVAQKAFNAVAKANPYVLLATAILTVVGALVAFTKGSKENEAQQKSLNTELERQIDVLKRLQSSYDLVYDKQKNALQNNLELLKAQGASTEEIRKVEDQLLDLEEQRIQNQKKNYKTQISNLKEYESEYNGWVQQYASANDELSDLERRLEENKNASDKGGLINADKSRALKKQIKEKKEEIEVLKANIDERKATIDELNKIEQDEANLNNTRLVREAERAAEDKALKEQANRDAKAAIDERKRLHDEEVANEKAYQEELKRARERAEDLRNDNEAEGVDKRIKQINTDYERQINEAELKAAEARNKKQLQLAEEYEAQVVELRKKRDALVAKERADEEKANQEELDNLLSQYQTYTEKEKAIRTKYQTDIEKLKKLQSSASTDEERLRYENAIAEAERMQNAELVELELEYGALNKLVEKRDELEKQILIVANKIKETEEGQEKEALQRQLSALKQQLKDINKEIAEADSNLDEIDDKLGEISATDAVEAVRGMAEAFMEMSGASDKAANDVSIIADGVSKVTSGYAQGGIAGAIFGAIDWAVSGMKELAAQTAKENEELLEFQMTLDKIQQSLRLGGWHDIFGEDTLGRINAIRGEYERLNKEARDFIKFYTENEVSNMYDFSKYRIAGLNNQNLEELSKEWGLSLFDDKGGYNTEFIQKVLDRYGKQLSADEKQLLQGLMNYSSSYQEAMTEIASYLESLFGGVADTIADQFIESFMKSGQAAMDFGDVMSDVAKNMVKNLIKSKLLDEVMNKYTDDFKHIMTDSGYDDQEQRQAALLGLFAQMGGEIEALQPYIQSLLEAYQTYIGDLDSETTGMSGNLLQAASQDSVDMLNGQLNAVRTNQSLVASRIENILIQLSGLRNDMNDGFNRSVRQLEEINDNTSEGGSLLRQLGLWIG